MFYIVFQFILHIAPKSESTYSTDFAFFEITFQKLFHDVMTNKMAQNERMGLVKLINTIQSKILVRFRTLNELIINVRTRHAFWFKLSPSRALHNFQTL